nr:MAG TPA: hypothetical protein [Bacteriophage sp.]
MPSLAKKGKGLAPFFACCGGCRSISTASPPGTFLSLCGEYAPCRSRTCKTATIKA